MNEEIKINLELEQMFFNQNGNIASAESLWSEILWKMPENSISEELLHFLVSNQIALVDLAHMNLPDKWLVKLIETDDAALYTLSRRYYLEDVYSEEEFRTFYNLYLSNKWEICAFLLRMYDRAAKKALLLSLCAQKYENEDMFQHYQLAENIRYMESVDDIRNMYLQNSKVEIVLKEIARNPYTPVDILRELMNIKGIRGAKMIREYSRENINLKRS